MVTVNERNLLTMANKFYSNVGKFFAPHVYPVLLDCNFTIDSTTALGVTGLVGPGIASVQAKGTASNSPENGFIEVFLGDPYYKLYGVQAFFQAPNSGSTAINALVANRIYVIASLGTSTTANWVTAGLPVGVTPAVGVAFQATGSTASLGTGTCSVSTVSTCSGVELVGSANLSLAPIGVGAASPYIYLKCVGATSSSDTTLIAKQPANGTKVYLQIYLSNSSVVVQGE
jgi:hypothetical protein